MTKQDITHSLETVFARIRSWPSEMQEDVLDHLEAIVGDFENPMDDTLTGEQLADLRASLLEADEATQEEIFAAFGRSFR